MDYASGCYKIGWCDYGQFYYFQIKSFPTFIDLLLISSLSKILMKKKQIIYFNTTQPDNYHLIKVKTKSFYFVNFNFNICFNYLYNRTILNIILPSSNFTLSASQFMIFNSINNQISQYDPPLSSSHKHKRFYIDHRNSPYAESNSKINPITSSFPRLSAQNDTFNPINRNGFYQSGTELSKMNKQIIENTEMFCKRSQVKRNKIFGHNTKSTSSQKSLSHLSQSNVSRSSNHSYDRSSKNSYKKFSDYEYDAHNYGYGKSKSNYRIFQNQKQKNYNPYMNKQTQKSTPLDLDLNRKKKQYSSPLVLFNYLTPDNQPVQDYRKQHNQNEFYKSPSRTLLLDRNIKKKSPTFRSQLFQTQDDHQFAQRSHPDNQIQQKDRFFDMDEAPSSIVKKISYRQVDPLPRQAHPRIEQKATTQKSFMGRLLQKYKQIDKDGKIISMVLIFLGILILLLQMIN